MTSSTKPQNTQLDPSAIAVFTAAPWESAVVVLRITGPAGMAGMRVIQGNQGPQVSKEAVAEADLVVIQRDFPRFWRDYKHIISLAREKGKPVIYDLDDLLVEIPHGHSHRGDYAGEILTMLYAIIDADLVTASSSNLVAYLSELNPNVKLIDNYLNDHLWVIRPPENRDEKNSKVSIGFMGGQTHRADLEYIKRSLLNVNDKFSDQVIYKFWGTQPPEELLSLPTTQWNPINQEDYAQFASFFSEQDCDILIAPLIDNAFNRAKSGLKFLEYSVLGAAGVYSNLPPYERMVVQGKNGFLADNLDDWETYLSTLIDNPSLRIQIASAAQQMVQQEWLLSSNYYQFMDIYQAALEEERKLLGNGQSKENLKSIISHSEEYQSDLEDRLYSVDNQLKEILDSRSWRYLKKIQNLRLKFIPKR
ncbi:MAG: glycosyltransferase [Anaerolineales bacterium]